MTELFEVKDFIQDLQDTADELLYEANTKPGHGIVFAAKLMEAKDLVDRAITKLTKAAEMLKKEDK